MFNHTYVLEGNEMKKTALIMLSILVLVTLSAFYIKPSQAYIQAVGWTNPTYRGNDDFYHQNVVAYQEGTYWDLSVMLLNDWGPPPDKTQINISTIIVHFGWGKNYTHRFATPEAIVYGETKVFTVSNMTPSTSEIPDIWTYGYRLYVEIVNATSGPTEVVTTWSPWESWDNNFAIYSAGHLETQQLRDKLEMMFMGGPTMIPLFNVSKAMVLFIEAYFEFQLGDQAHSLGDFYAANIHYGNASDLVDEALNVYEQRGTAMEDAALNYKEALANATKTEADANLISANAALVNSYAWMFFGIGWVLIGIGVIIYGAKKPKPPQ